MAKKKTKVQIASELQNSNSTEKVYSEKYQCLITKKDSYFDGKLNTWLNNEIENKLPQRLKRKKQIGLI